MFLTHYFDEHFLGNRVVFMARQHLAHFVITIFLFLNIVIAFLRADIAVEPIAGVNSFYWLAHMLYFLISRRSPLPDSFNPF